MANPPVQTPKPPPAPPPRPTPPPPPAPKPPQNPPPPAAKAEAHAQAVSKEPIPSGPKDPQEAKLELAERGARDRKVEPPVKTIADEQRERSDAMAAKGIDAWKAEHDERSPDDKPKVVPGIQQRPVEAHEIRR